MRILVIRLSSMGDVILVTPLLSALKDRNSDAEITLLTKSQYAGMFKDDKRIAKVISYSKESVSESFLDGKNSSWDLVVDLQNSRRSREVIRKYIKYSKVVFFDKLHLKRLFLFCFRVDLYKGELNVAERYIDASALIDSNKDSVPSVKLFFDSKKRSRFEKESDYDKSRPVMAMFPFSAWKNKEWLHSYYAEVGKHFISKGWSVVLLGGPEDISAANTLKLMIGESCISLVGKMDLYETGLFFKSCKLAIGNDTGLSHFARACGIKTAIIYGSTTYHFGFFPYKEPAYKIIERRTFCRPCHPHGGDFCWRFSRPCLKMIKPARVIEDLEKLLES